MYIQLDGQLSGEGLYYLNGFPIEIGSLPLSQGTIEWLRSWLQRYWLAIYAGFKKYKKTERKGKLIDLDEEGLRLKSTIQREIQEVFPDIFITYWSEARGAHLNDNGELITNWEEMVSS